jgi:hypothetical protein
MRRDMSTRGYRLWQSELLLCEAAGLPNAGMGNFVPEEQGTGQNAENKTNMIPRGQLTVFLRALFATDDAVTN